jgi:thiamine-phosphate pyrophosphorylase
MIPRLYAIVDAQVLAKHRVGLEDFASELRAAGVGLAQYRDKAGSPHEVLRAATLLRAVFAGGDKPNERCDGGVPIVGCPDLHVAPLLVMNDRADLAVLAEFDGVHVGQRDLLPEDARHVVGASKLVGVSTHTEEQVRVAERSSADYVAIGPVFATGTKANAEQVVGLDGVRRARALTRKPLVAIGGITRENARSLIDAGADSVAVISGLFVAGESVEKVARDFIELLA